MRPPNYGAICLVMLLGAGSVIAQDGRGGVKYSAWSAKKGKSCTVAINIVDPGNFKHYELGFTGNILAVNSPGGPITAATLQIDNGRKATLTCLQTLCYTAAEDQDRLFTEMRRGWAAKLDLRLASGVQAGPFEIPLAGFEPSLRICGIAPLPRPNFRDLNPEPRVAPVPKRP